MALPIVIVTSGGLAITESTNGIGLPVVVADNGFGMPARIVASGGLAVLGSASGSTDVPDAPVLTWTSAVTDTTPNFSVNLPDGLGAPHDAATGDVIYLEIADNISFSTTETDELDAGDISGDPVEMVQATPLADATYFARARLKRGANFGPYSNVETKTIDTTAPTITSSNAVNLAENVALSHTLTANETVTWTKTGGADTALFTLAGSNLSMTAKNFEAPADADTNNTYVVQVTATDTAGNATNQTITVTVTDVNEFSLDWVSGANESSGLTTITYPSLAFGSADPSRIIVVAIAARMTTVNTITSVTIGGVAATLVSSSVAQVGGTNGSNSAIYQAAVPTGATGSVVVTYGAATSRTGVSVYRLITGTPNASSANTYTNVAGNPATAAITVPTGGKGLACVWQNSGTSVYTWTNATPSGGDYQVSAGAASRFSSASVTTIGSVSPSASAAGGTSSQILSAAAWGP